MSRALPDRYPFAEKVPAGKNGGARCSTCHYLVPADDSKSGEPECRNKFYVREHGGRDIPESPDGFCCSAWSGKART